MELNYEILVQDTNTGQGFDITSLAGDISISSELRGAPSRMTFVIQQDPNNILTLSPGSILSFRVNGKGIFWGYMFILGTDATGIYKITAYDQLRYLKNEETIYTENMTADQIFSKLCNIMNVKSRVVTPSPFIVPPYFHDKRQAAEIIGRGILQANIADRRQYFIKDVYGTLEFTELMRAKTDVIIGDKSLLSSYQYELSIDKDSFNRIKVYKDDEKAGIRDVYIEQDSDNIRRWGFLQYLVQADAEQSEAEIHELATNLLKLKNRVTKTMRLTALGIDDLVAGSGFQLVLEKLGLNESLWILRATHRYTRDVHTMDLEVFLGA